MSEIEYPAYVTSAVQYGLGVQALATKLSGDHKMLLEKISRLFADLCGDELNSETVETALEQGYELAAPLEETVRKQLRQAKTAHFDKTGLRIRGKLGWLHAACNEWYTHLSVHEKCGEAALRSPSSVLKDFQGYAIHDSWVSSFKFARRQYRLCDAHIVRELQALIEAGSSWAEQMRSFLLELYAHVRPPSETAAQQSREWSRQIFSQAEQEEPLPRPQAGKGCPKNTMGRNLLCRLKEQEEAVLAFALVKGVPFTNNQAERDLRPAKVKQKEQILAAYYERPSMRAIARLFGVSRNTLAKWLKKSSIRPTP